MIIEQNNSKLIRDVLEIGSFIGNTPLFKIRTLTTNKSVNVFAKLEWNQLGGSVKGRPAYAIIKEAVLAGKLTTEMSLLDASSGNTAIAYAAIGAACGIPVTICLPENASQERKLLLTAYGAEVRYTSRFGGTDEAQEHAKNLFQQYPDRYFYADQYNNDNNWKAHYAHTATEIIEQTGGQLTHFVAGLGTTGTFTGTSRRLKEEVADLCAISLQPDEALHGLEGWKHLETAKVPGIYDSGIANHDFGINTYEAIGLIPEIAQKEGLLLSPSSAANLLGALEVARTIEKGTIVTVFPDNAEKYSEVLKSIF